MFGPINKSNQASVLYCLAPTCHGFHEVDTDSLASLLLLLDLYNRHVREWIAKWITASWLALPRVSVHLQGSLPIHYLRMKVVDDILKNASLPKMFLDLGWLFCFSIPCYALCPNAAFVGGVGKTCATRMRTLTSRKCPSQPPGSRFCTFGTAIRCGTECGTRRANVQPFVEAPSESEGTATLAAIFRKTWNDLGLRL